ncbi:hypothetical protein AAG747_10620 [Rapidithrix thailandica]|uniref:Uncharacterized protein n=1 Tax=Rapidithrix thailandica TaxID=413964 RepID=A0AAW9S3C1_9BACT
MKKIAIFLVFLTGCIPYKSYLKTDDICGFDMTITEEEKSYNPSIYGDLTQGIKIDSGGFTLVTYKYQDKLGGYFLSRTNKTSQISKWINYDSNGRVSLIYFVYEMGGLIVGKETHYDSLGNITQVIDHRQVDKYPICYKEALMIAEKLKPKKDSILGIDREWEATVTDTLYYWEVFVKEPKPDKDEPTLGDGWIYRIDAQTGKLLRKMQLIQGHDDTAP